MSILLDERTPVIVQGFTGDKGTFHANEMIAYGTNVVGGVTPGKGGATHLERPVFNTVKEAVAVTGAAASLVLVPAPFCAKAVMLIGEIGGPQEADAALFVRDNMTKPVIGYVAGLTAPRGRRMGHAGAIISAFGDTAAEKAEIMRSAGLVVAPSPAELGSTVA